MIKKCVATTQYNIPEELNPHNFPYGSVHFMRFVQKLLRTLHD
jgi:hypothetical protein